MSGYTIIDLTPENIADYGVCGYKDVKKQVELRRKIEWFSEYYPKGLRIKVILSESGSYQGMLEYIPGEYAHRPVNADGYMFIHCMFVGFRKEFKGQGFASALLEECIQEARDQKMSGVAVVTRKGSFMIDGAYFLKKGFRSVGKVKPDFELMALKFDGSAQDPEFKPDMEAGLEKYQKGLKVLRSPQCPYTEKNVNAILETARNKYNLDAELVDMTDVLTVQDSPCGFGTFCIIHDGEIISHHPISNGRFENIMKKRV